MKTLILASMAAAVISLPMATQASAQTAPAPDDVQNGRTIEAFLGSNLANVQGYPANTDVTMEVVRNGVVVGSKTMTTDGEGFMEINHVGGADCWDVPATPDIMGGDVLRTTTAGDPAGTVDYATVRDVDVEFAGITTDPAQGTITVSGNVKSLDNAPIAPGSDVLELRLNKGSTDLWDVFPGGDQEREGRRDLRVDIGAQVQPNGNWERTLNVGSQDARDWDASPGEVFLEWSAAAGAGEEEEAAPPSIFVADEGEGGVPGCPPIAEDAMTDSSRNIVNIANQGKNLKLSGVSFGATGVNVAVPGGAQRAATITPVDAAAPDGHQTWTATIPAAELAALKQGKFLARATFEGAGVSQTASTLTLRKDTIAPKAPTATPKPGVYQRTQFVALETNAKANKIHFTQNGSRPGPNSQLFKRQIRVSATQKIKAVAIDRAGNRSTVAGFRYVIR